MQNPLLKNLYTFLSYITVWILLILVQFILLIVSSNISINYSIYDSLIFNIIFSVIGLNLWFPVKFISFENNSAFRILINHTVGALAVSAFWVAFSYTIINSFVTLSAYEKVFLFNSLFVRFLIGILYYIIIVSVNYIIIYYNNFKEKVTNENQLQNLVKEAELKTLKYQINPHFIFNSLNSISSLTLSNPQKAQEMTIKLSSFIRSTLAKTDNQFVKLLDELSNVRLYLEIEKVRFEGKFDYIETIVNNCLDINVPTMLLQPLFENAIKHGVYESLEKVIIKFNCSIDKEYLKIIISNNFDIDAVHRKGEGIGIKNIKNRLQLIYKQDNLLTVRKQDGVYTATIFIPLKKD
ncbi:MAG: histidine kinase [bacterium]